jgi:hypothetical protein
MHAPADVPLDAVRELAVKERVCVRPLLRRVVDTVTGEAVMVTLPCQSTRESQCPSCAAKARALRVQQCLEGWHLDLEPDPSVRDREVIDDSSEGADDDETDRRSRSTRRRDDVPDLPRIPQEDRTIGRTFEGRNGRTYRPSMFITLTLPSYGKVIAGSGVPADPIRYNYRRAALDALHFSKLLDRWFQNVRRCAGYKVQYFGAVEAQRRLAPHFHVATRGALPRQLIKRVTKATYLSLWWPRMDHVHYTDVLPEWDGHDYVDPETGVPLHRWEDALTELDQDPEASPAHVMRLGAQIDVKGLIAGEPDTDRAVRYLTKYLTKSLAETYSDEGQLDAAYEAHIDRLHREVRFLPCTPDCPNWLRFGIQPRTLGPGMRPGFCPSKAHDREHLGLGGRRVLVSRGWSGKRLSDHKADRSEVVRQALNAAGIEMPVADRMAAQVRDENGGERFQWAAVVGNAGTRSDLLMKTIQERRRWREDYERAKTLVGANGPPVESNSATGSDGGGDWNGEALHA